MSLAEQIELVQLITGNQQVNQKLVAFYLTAAENFILTYCGICTLPPALQQVQVQIAAKMLMEQTTIGSSGMQQGSVGSETGAIAGLGDGNQSVSYVQNKGMAASFSYDEQSIIDAFGSILNRYRRFTTDGKNKSLGTRRPGGFNELDHYTAPNVTRRREKC